MQLNAFKCCELSVTAQKKSLQHLVLIRAPRFLIMFENIETSAVNRKYNHNSTDTSSCAKLRLKLGLITRLIKCCHRVFFMETGRVGPR